MTRIGLLDSGLGLLGTADALFNLAPDADLVRLLADARSAIVCPPQDARSAIARPPRDADAPDGYFAGYCVVM